VDAMLRCMSWASQESQAIRAGPVQMRMGVVNVMAKIIEFYIPAKFRTRRIWIPVVLRGKLIEFPPTEKKSA
jgi:hypothetical protein